MYHYLYGDLCRIPTLRFHIFHGRFGGDSFVEHSHEFGEPVLVRRGSGVHFCEHGECPISVGDVFCVKPDEVHGYKDMSNLAYCDIVFDPAIFLDPHPELLTVPGYQAVFHVEPLMQTDLRFSSRLHLDGPPLNRASELIESLNTEYEASIPDARP